jgi:hypothetical protein
LPIVVPYAWQLADDREYFPIVNGAPGGEGSQEVSPEEWLYAEQCRNKGKQAPTFSLPLKLSDSMCFFDCAQYCKNGDSCVQQDRESPWRKDSGVHTVIAVL